MKLLLLSFLSVCILHASAVNHQTKILEKILTETSVDKEILVWSDNKLILEEIKKNGVLKTTNSCENATLLLIENENKLIKECRLKYIFVLNYNLLSEIPQSFGALFWKKGRPNIVILEPRLKEQKITITENLEPYLEEKVW